MKCKKYDHTHFELAKFQASQIDILYLVVTPIIPVINYYNVFNNVILLIVTGNTYFDKNRNKIVTTVTYHVSRTGKKEETHCACTILTSAQVTQNGVVCKYESGNGTIFGQIKVIQCLIYSKITLGLMYNFARIKLRVCSYIVHGYYTKNGRETQLVSTLSF